MLVKNILNDLKLIAFKEKYKENNLNFWLKNFENNSKGNSFYLNFNFDCKKDKKLFTHFLHDILLDFFNSIECENNSDIYNILYKIEISLVDFNFNYKFNSTGGQDIIVADDKWLTFFNGTFQNYDEIQGKDFADFYDNRPEECLCEKISESLFLLICENVLLNRITSYHIENGVLNLNQFIREINITFEFIDEKNNLDDLSTTCDKKENSCYLN